MKKFTIIIFISLLFSCSISKKTESCSINLNKELAYAKSKNKIDYENDYKILEKCAKFDSIDKMMFSSKDFGGIVINLVIKKEKLTYGNVLNKINDIKNNDIYKKQKELVYLSEKIKKTIISKNNWQEDKIALNKIGVNGKYLDEFQKFILQYENTNTTYRTAINQFYNKYNKDFEFKKFINYKESLNSSLKEKKYLLLYFSGYSAINCREMEKKIIMNQDIKSILNQNFTSYILYADSRKKLSKKYISQKTGKEISTIGNQICDLQISKFNSNRQPYFVILDSNGNILKEQGYTSEIDVFIKFLRIE